MPHRDIVVIGASAGGVEALQDIVRGLPSDLDASIFAVVHISASSPGLLRPILQSRTSLAVVDPKDGEPIKKGRVYVGQPDHHLLIEGGHVRLTRGPKENRSRPSVDALFRSAAYACGPRVIGIVLTGHLDDGTAGLWAVKQRGGTAVVQNPQDARHPSMPESALRYTAADHVVALAEMAALITELTRRPVLEKEGPMTKELELETAIARGDERSAMGVMDLGPVSPFTCPECHGVLVSLKGGGVPRFRCHTGHSFSIATLLAEVTVSIEDSFWSAIRAVEESIMLLSHMARHAREAGDMKTAELLAQKAVEAQTRADRVRQVTMEHEVLGSL